MENEEMDLELNPAFFLREEFKIDPDKPWGDDLLEREKLANSLTEILDEVTQPVVMSLSSSFGTGKTTFINSWAQALKNKGTHTILFNAWETDYAADPFIAFVAAIKAQLPDAAAKKLVKAAGRVGVKSLGLVAKNQLAKLTGEAAIDFIMEEINGQATAEKTVKDFQAEFAKIIENKCGGRLIIFVDELDRCRPSYAVEVLERIKHLFAVKGVIFVLAIDKDQLVNAIKGVYGADLDADGYLRKFIDWDYTLPKPSTKNYVKFLCRDIFKTNECFDSFNSHEKKPNAGKVFIEPYDFENMISATCDVMDIPLRTIEKSMTYANLVMRKYWQNACGPRAGFVAFLQKATPDFYNVLCEWKPDRSFINVKKAEDFIEKIVLWERNYIEQENVQNKAGVAGVAPRLPLCFLSVFAKCSLASDLHSDENVVLHYESSVPVARPFFGDIYEQKNISGEHRLDDLSHRLNRLDRFFRHHVFKYYVEDTFDAALKNIKDLHL